MRWCGRPGSQGNTVFQGGCMCHDKLCQWLQINHFIWKLAGLRNGDAIAVLTGAMTFWRHVAKSLVGVELRENWRRQIPRGEPRRFFLEFGWKGSRDRGGQMGCGTVKSVLKMRGLCSGRMLGYRREWVGRGGTWWCPEQVTQWQVKDEKRVIPQGRRAACWGPGVDKGGFGNLRRGGKVWTRKGKEGIVRIVAGH